MTTMKRILVLGGTGFHGKEVMRIAKERGYRVFSVALDKGTDLRDIARISKKLQELKPDVIINCAGHEGTLPELAKHGANIIYDNVMMAVNLYQAVSLLKKKPKITNALGNCSYPGDAELQTETQWESGPVHESVIPTAAEKRLVYALAHSYHKQYGIKSVNWLVSNSYGPGGSIDISKLHALNGILVRMIQAQKRGDTKFEIWGTGKPIREWTYVEDVARILADSIDIGEQIYPINFAHNQGHSINDIATLAARVLAYDVEFVYNTSKPDGAMVKVLDDKQFRSKYPDFKFTPLEIGIQKTIEYYRKIL